MVVPAGGLTTDGKFRIGSKKFFIPVKVMAKLFRGKFLFYLKKLRHLFQSVSETDWQDIFYVLYRKDWYAYCKRPFKSPASVLQYLGRYTHRIAISNHRILGMDNGVVAFSYRDYKDKSKKKIMLLPANEFILYYGNNSIKRVRYCGRPVKNVQAWLLFPRGFPCT